MGYTSYSKRWLHEDDVLPLWRKIRGHLRKAQVTFDDEHGDTFYVSIEKSGWRFNAKTFGYCFKPDGTVDWENANVNIEYAPPDNHGVWFEAHVQVNQALFKQDEFYQKKCPELVREFGEFLNRYRHLCGRLCEFEQLPNAKPAQPTSNVADPFVRHGGWLSSFFARIGL